MRQDGGESSKLGAPEDLLGGLVHDLNNQLTPLLGYLELVLKNMSPDDPCHGLLLEAEQAALRCAEAVRRSAGGTKSGGPLDPSNRDSQMPRGNETVLFADDEESLRNIGRSILERLGYKVILAVDGEEAVALYEKNRKAIGGVVLDMAMPKLTGREAMKRILGIDPAARILLASGFTPAAAVKDLLREGAAEFLPKPYTAAPLAAFLRKVLDTPAR